jgi:MinD superfamily P-loop ATPase
MLNPGESNLGKIVMLVRQTQKSPLKKKLDLIVIDGSPGMGCPVIACITG